FDPMGWLKGIDLADLPESERRKQMRSRLFAAFAVVLALIAGCAVLWWLMIGARFVSTDNAYVQVSSAQVTPLTSGTVLDVPVHNTQSVRKGDVLLTIDQADAQLGYNQAEAGYQLTIRKVQGYFTALDARKADVDRARLDYDRREKIAKSGAVSGDEIAAVRNAYESAKAGLAAAEALTHGTDVMSHPEVLAAKAARDTAKLNLDRTVVRSPVDGVVTNRSVQVGQRVQAGTTVMMVVPVSDVYVDANFKEDQLAKVRTGQPAVLTSDLYGSSVKFHGRVAGLSGGTGSAFSVIPAQNATGNWIKVVQRVPLRIELDRNELAAHPLRVGLSMDVTIDVSK
ncbi:MAG: HlyD family secretion protein, partial [Rhizomicrobium sp.]